MAEGRAGYHDKRILDKASEEAWKLGDPSPLAQPPKQLLCPRCCSGRLYKDGLRRLSDGAVVQRWLCRGCEYRFSEKEPLRKKPNWQINTAFASLSNCQVCDLAEESKNLNTTTETKIVVGDERPALADLKGKLVEYLWHLKKQGYSEDTVKTRVKLLTQLAREGVNLFKAEDVKKAIAARETWGNGHKQIVVHAYNGFIEMQGQKWDPPVYINDKSLPFIPLEREIDALISGCSKKIAISLQLLKETGMRIGEAWKLKWTDLDEEQNTMRCRAEKHGNPRAFKISPKLVSMLNTLPKTSEYVFANSNLSAHRWRFDRQKRRLSEKLQNPRLLQIKFHTLRHFFATKLYDQTKSLPIVQEKLGHRSVVSTMVYTHLVEFDEESQNYYHATAKDEKDAGSLIDQGFTYVCTTPQDIMMFRKRK